MSRVLKSLAIATTTFVTAIATATTALAQAVPNMQQGMPYDQARQMILETGWRPIEVNQASRGEQKRLLWADSREEIWPQCGRFETVGAYRLVMKLTDIVHNLVIITT